jgi:hypothetical protein
MSTDIAPQTTTPTPTTSRVTSDGDRQRALATLRRAVAGPLHTPADTEWDHVRRPWALLVDQTPLAVLEVRDAADVQAAVRWAVDHDVQVTAQPVGHGASAESSGFDQVLMLRTRALQEIDVDVVRRTAWVGAGVKAGELLAALDGTGLTYLTGSNPDPSVVGMTITGGISWFGRAYGLGANSIVAVDMVDGLGRARRVSATEDPDLFWAIRGGGGDFGIITRMQVRLHPAPNVYGGRLMWPIERAAEVLRAFRAVTETAPPELTTWVHIWQFPPLPFVPEPLRGKSFTGVAVAFLGSREDAERLLAPLRAVPGVAMDLMGDVPISAVGEIAAEPTDPMPSIEQTTLLTHIDDELIDGLVSTLGAGSGSPLVVAQIRHLGAGFAVSEPGQGAIGHVPEPYHFFSVGVPATPDLAAAITGRMARVDEVVAPYTNGRALVNFIGHHGDSNRSWSPEVRARLAEVKQAHDPLDTIRSNRPVRV